MRIGIDVDGVLADFNESFIRRSVVVTNRDMYPPRPFDIPTWNYPQHYGYTEAEVATIWESIEKDPSFWAFLTPYDWTRSFLKRLDPERDDIYFITSRLGVNPKRQTEAWLRYYGSDSFPTVMISSLKGACCEGLNLDAYVDDRDKNVFDVRSRSPKTRIFLLDQPWNRDPVYDWKGIQRIDRPDEMLDLLGL